MLPKVHRLTTAEIKDVLKNARHTYRTPFFHAKWLFRKKGVQSSLWKVGFVLSKKQIKSAVGRHELRRAYMRLLSTTTLTFQHPEAQVRYCLFIKNEKKLPSSEDIRKLIEYIEASQPVLTDRPSQEHPSETVS